MTKILVIDDDPAIRLMLSKALKVEGHDVVLTTNGREGIDRAQELHPALIICDWMMPRLSGLEVCRQIKSIASLTSTFFILLTARGELEDRIEGLDTGADDFLTKPIEIKELQARVRAGLRLHELNIALRRQKERLEAELSEAAGYVQSLLPANLSGSVTVESCFIPSQQLGGDCFDYHWLDPDNLMMCLLDVSGHGLGAALPSVTVLNLLRSHSLPDANFYRPHDVLRALNEVFQMEGQNAKYFTIWYGVYNRIKQQLTYATAGHPPAILVSQQQDQSPLVQRLKTIGMPIGMLPDSAYISDRKDIPSGSNLYIFSDGIYDISFSNDTWNLNHFIELLGSSPAERTLEEIVQKVRDRNRIYTFEDDLSLLKVQFPE